MIRIFKIEKFIPKTGNPVFQINEELESDGRISLLDPRNPTPEELSDADDQFAAAQQATITELTAQRDELQSQLKAANAKIVELQNALPWNVRIIDAQAFIARLSPFEAVDLFGSDDPVKQSIAAMLKEYSKPENDWPIIFESPEMQQAMGYLMQSGSITAERAAELLRDSTRDEAYKAGE